MTARPRAIPPVLLLLALLAAPAAAHSDIPVVEGTRTIPAGDVLVLPVDLHYHRLVGHVRVVAPQDASVAVRILGPDGARDVAGPASDLKLNALIPCCKHESWSPHVIEVGNAGGTPAEVRLRLVLLHDGVAVTGDDAESGALFSTLAIFGGVAFLFARTLPRRAPEGSGAARPWALAAAGLHASMWLTSGALAAWGVPRYGGGPIAGGLAATADLPPTDGIIFTTHTLVQLGLLLLWAASVGAWTAAARRARGGRRAVALVGIALGVGSLLACLIWAVEYSRVLAPALVGLASAALPIGGGAWLLAGGSDRGARDGAPTA